jgi:hypothetical protein
MELSLLGQKNISLGTVENPSRYSSPAEQNVPPVLGETGHFQTRTPALGWSANP